jgi:hemoglobin
MTQQTPYELLGKDDGIKALANAFYDAMDSLPNAEHIRKMHAASLTDVKQKLYEYLSGWLGGPDIYREKYGHICLTDQHKPFTINSNDRDQWLHCFDYALDEINASEEVKVMLKQPMFRMADFLVNS